jgi:hypothetical protein
MSCSLQRGIGELLISRWRESVVPRGRLFDSQLGRREACIEEALQRHVPERPSGDRRTARSSLERDRIYPSETVAHRDLKGDHERQGPRVDGAGELGWHGATGADSLGYPPTLAEQLVTGRDFSRRLFVN